jgi:hypothetical protein
LRAIAKKEGFSDYTQLWWKAARVSGDWEFRKVTGKSRYVAFAGSFKEIKEARRALRYDVLPYPKRGA